jgi:hypothetical protein
MEPVRYFVPTRGRVGRQLTLRSLPEGLHPLVTLVCPEDEVLAHRADWPLVDIQAQPDHIKTIGAKREYIFRELSLLTDFAWQLDDDLSMKICLSHQFKDTKKYSGETFDWFRSVLPMYQARYDVLGLGTSYFAQKGGLRTNYHLGFAFGMSFRARQQIEMNRMDVFEDIDYTLQVLRKGITNAVCYDVTVDQRQPDAPGGVTGERDDSTIRRDLARLIAYHPGIVSEKPLRPGAHPAAVTRVLWAKAAKEGGLRE